MQNLKRKFLFVVVLAVAVSTIAGASLMRGFSPVPETDTTSVRVHNIQGGGWLTEGPMDFPRYFQLDIEHRYAAPRPTYYWWRDEAAITVPDGETRYLVLNFTIHISEINGSSFDLYAMPDADVEVYFPGFDLDFDLGLTGKIHGFGLKVVVEDLPECCWLSSKYLLYDNYGEDCQNDVSFLVVVDLDATKAERDWRLPDVKVYVNNLFVCLWWGDDIVPELWWHGPMVHVHVDELLMTEGEFIDFWAKFHQP